MDIAVVIYNVLCLLWKVEVSSTLSRSGSCIPHHCVATPEEQFGGDRIDFGLCSREDASNGANLSTYYDERGCTL